MADLEFSEDEIAHLLKLSNGGADDLSSSFASALRSPPKAEVNLDPLGLLNNTVAGEDYNYVTPEENRRLSGEVARNVGALGLEMAGAVLAPQIAVPRVVAKIGTSGGLASRLAGYGKTAVQSALGAASGRQIAQRSGLADDKTLGQEFDRTAIDRAVGS